MSENAESSSFLAGVPIAVDPEKIDRELSGLWKPAEAAEGHSAATRACLSSLIFHLPDLASCERARDLLPAIGKRFPSRILLLTHGADPKKNNGARLSASVTAVCHLTSPGAPPICCEQITLESKDKGIDVFLGAVAPLLVPDVPVSLVALCAGSEDIIGLLAPVLDQIVLDSRRLPLAALARANDLIEEHPDLGVDDLAWRDTIHWRRTICDIFDLPEARAKLETLERIEVRHEAGSGIRAALVAGWLISRLGREFPVKLAAEEPSREDPGQLRSVHLIAKADGSTSELKVSRAPGARLLKIEYHSDAHCVVPTTVPFRKETDAELLGGALEHRTHQGALRAALRAAAGLAAKTASG